MGKKAIKNEGKEYFLESTWAMLAMEAGVWVYNNYFGGESDYAWPVALALGSSALARWLNSRPRPLWQNYTIAAARFDSGQLAKVNGATWLLHSIPFIFNRDTKAIKYKEPSRRAPLGQKLWTVKIPERSKPTTITEARLFKFCQLAWVRQEKGISHPMSRNWFLDEAHYSFAAYQGCTIILYICHLLEGRGQGTSGRLLYPPTKTVRLVGYIYPSDGDV